MKITIIAMIERQRARFYIHKNPKKMRNGFIYKKPDTFQKARQFLLRFCIYKKPYTLRYGIFHNFLFNLAFNFRLKSLTVFSGALIPPHHYKRNVAHLLAFQNSVIEF